MEQIYPAILILLLGWPTGLFVAIFNILSGGFNSIYTGFGYACGSITMEFGLANYIFPTATFLIILAFFKYFKSPRSKIKRFFLAYFISNLVLFILISISPKPFPCF